MKPVSQFYHQQLCRDDRLTLGLEMALIFAGLICVLLNLLTFNGAGHQYLSVNWIWIIPTLMSIGYFSVFSYQKNPKTLFLVLKNYVFYILGFFAFFTLIDGVQYTPFPVMDPYFFAADRCLGAPFTRLNDWAFSHPAAANILNMSHSFMLLQLLVMPLILTLWAKDQFYVFIKTSLVALMLGAMLFYFFPVDYFYHNGLLTFPFLIVGWSVVIIYSLRKGPSSLFIPFLILNLLSIFASMVIGWISAINVVIGVLVASLAIVIGKRLN